MPGVYSTRFLIGGGPGPYVYTVAAGKVAVIKQLSSGNTTTAVGQVVLYINGFLVWLASVPVNSGVNAAGQSLVVNAGEELKLATSAAGVTVVCSGYLLDKLA